VSRLDRWGVGIYSPPKRTYGTPKAPCAGLAPSANLPYLALPLITHVGPAGVASEFVWNSGAVFFHIGPWSNGLTLFVERFSCGVGRGGSYPTESRLRAL